MKALEIMHGVCARDHLEDGIFPHDSDGHTLQKMKYEIYTKFGIIRQLHWAYQNQV